MQERWNGLEATAIILDLDISSDEADCIIDLAGSGYVRLRDRSGPQGSRTRTHA